MQPGLEHGVPMNLWPAERVRQVRGHIVPRNQRQGCGAINRRHKILRQHQNRNGVRVECLEGPVRHNPEMAEERPVEHRSEPGLAEQADHLMELNAVEHLYIKPGEQSWIGVDAHDSTLHGPARPRSAIPADQACPPDLLSSWAITFEELA